MSATTTDSVKIQDLSVKNFRKVKLIELKPEQNFLVINGKNAQGKTSLLDAIANACGGTKSDVKMPVHTGEEKAEINITLTNGINIRQYYTNTGGYGLTVKQGEDFKVDAGSTFLKRFYEDTQFEPLAFLRAKAKDQVETLMAIAKIDFAKLDEEYSEQFEARKEAKKEVDRIEKLMSELPDRELLDNAPDEEVSVAELSRKLAELQTKNNEVAQRSLRIQTLTDNIAKCDEAIKELEERIAKIKVDKAGFEKAKADLEATPGEIVPTGDLETQIENAEKTNRLVRLKKQREEKRAEHKAAATTVFESNKRLEEITEAKKKMVKEAKMPIDGLSFDSEGPLFHGIPLAERSSSEQLRVCLAIAKATRKQMAVLIVRDASLLDEDALAEVKQFAEDNDVQILLEVVGEYTGGEAITIEDGMVKELVS